MITLYSPNGKPCNCTQDQVGTMLAVGYSREKVDVEKLDAEKAEAEKAAKEKAEMQAEKPAKPAK